MSLPFISSPSYPVFHSEAKFHIVGFEFCISERAPSKNVPFPKACIPVAIGTNGEAQSFMNVELDRAPGSHQMSPAIVSRLWKLRPGALSPALTARASS